MLVLFAVMMFSKGLAVDELKHELEHAQKELKVAQERVEHLQYAIAMKEIDRIEELIKKAEVKMANRLPKPEFLALLTKQRETLVGIMHEHPLCADRAQHVHNEILAYLTKLDNQFDHELISQNVVR